MSLLAQFRFLFHLTRGHAIARRYFVTNGFDGALTMLGLTMGFYTSANDIATSVIIHACLGATVALTVSGLVSAYMSEAAEREKELQELEQAVVTDLKNTVHGQAARLVPILVAAVNGCAPLFVALLIITPLWLSELGFTLPLAPLPISIAVAFVILFLLGVFLGTISRRFWLWSGLRMLLIGLLTAALIVLLD